MVLSSSATRRSLTDGSDGFAYYWYDIRREESIFSRRQNGGDSIMVWGGFSANGMIALAILEGNQDSDKYIQTLSDYLMPLVDELHGKEWIFMQDGASILGPTRRKWLSEAQVNVMDWPAKSPDLNPIENMCSVLARAVYHNARQFADVDELQQCVEEEWANIRFEYLDKLLESMPKRCVDVLQTSGLQTKY